MDQNKNEKTGQIHLYTGNGKGKTTAAFGVALRTLCCGRKVYVGQFVKNVKYVECGLMEYFKELTIEQFGKGCFIGREPDAEDVNLVRKGIDSCAEKLRSGDYDLVILDELTIAIHYSVVPVEDVIAMLNDRHPKTEVIIAGRYAPEELYEIADLVTEMQEVKHYYQKGLISRRGIDC